ncbi:MAG: hypothetical protein JOS17DRAFT_766612 [Linnemannia elongata]|nr:MAG: hypothetical protein JOS17DRAFT_766612 [Linnemannia elongata]
MVQGTGRMLVSLFVPWFTKGYFFVASLAGGTLIIPSNWHLEGTKCACLYLFRLAGAFGLVCVYAVLLFGIGGCKSLRRCV